MDLQAKDARSGLKAMVRACLLDGVVWLVDIQACLLIVATATTCAVLMPANLLNAYKVFHHVLITDVLKLRSSALMIY